MIINLIDRVKHTFSKDKALSSSLHSILGFYPRHIEIYRVALAHKSQAYRNQKGKPLNNERLEFLGDAILEAVVSDIVFHRYERKREGFLTSTRSKIVQRSTLNRLATELGLDRLIKSSAQSNSHNSNIGGNAFEALVGAIYLDRGYRYSKWFVEKRIMGRLLDIDGVAQKEVNFKSKLLEWTQKNRIHSEYQFEQTSGEGNNSPVFYSTIVIEGLTAGVGKGYSKKESQQTAAKEALTKLRREPQFVDSIFRAKEKRTAMEADEICALPKIDEIEEEIRRQENRPNVSRNAKPAPNRRDNAATTAQKQPAAKVQASATPAQGTAKKSEPDAQKQQQKGKQQAAQKPQQEAQKQRSAARKPEQERTAAEKPAERTTERPAERAAKKNSEKNGEKAAERNAEKKATANSTEKPAETAEPKTAPSADAPAPAETAERPARRRPARRPKTDAPAERTQTEQPDGKPAAPAATEEKPAATEQPATTEVAAPAAETAPAERPARRQRQRQRPRVEIDDEDAISADRAAREAIVRQAEEAAYNEE